MIKLHRGIYNVNLFERKDFFLQFSFLHIKNQFCLLLIFVFLLKGISCLFLWRIVYINYNLLAHTVFKLINRVSHFPNFPFDFGFFFFLFSGDELFRTIRFNLWIIDVCLLVFNYGHFGCY